MLITNVTPIASPTFTATVSQPIHALQISIVGLIATTLANLDAITLTVTISGLPDPNIIAGIPLSQILRMQSRLPNNGCVYEAGTTAAVLAGSVVLGFDGQIPIDQNRQMTITLQGLPTGAGTALTISGREHWNIAQDAAYYVSGSFGAGGSQNSLPLMGQDAIYMPDVTIVNTMTLVTTERAIMYDSWTLRAMNFLTDEAANILRAGPVAAVFGVDTLADGLFTDCLFEVPANAQSLMGNASAQFNYFYRLRKPIWV